MDSSDGSDGDGEGVGVQALAHTETQPEALAGGRPGAFDQFYRDHHARIFNLVARIVGDPDDAADITQEVFLRAYTHPLHATDALRPEPWLYRIAVNASYDHLRRRAARPSTPLDAVPEVAARGDCFAAAETTRLVEGCLAGLTPRYRTALILRDLHGLSTAEIAQVMDVHQGAARVLLHRARSAFRKAFRSAAPTGAGGASALGLAAFLPDLPVPARLLSPPVLDVTPPAAGTPAAPHAACPPSGVEQAMLPVGAPAVPVGVPVAAATAAAAPVTAGVLAGAGGIAGLKVAVAVLATVVVTGGGVAAGHFADTPAVRDGAGTATRAGAVTAPLVGRDGAAWTHREMIRDRLQAAGLAPADAGSGRGAPAGDGSGTGAQSQGGPVANGGGGTGTGSGAAVAGGAGTGGAGGTEATGGSSGSGATTGGDGNGSLGTDTGTSGASSGGTGAPGGASTTGTGGTGGEEAGPGGGTGDAPTSDGTGSGTGSNGGGG